MLSELNTSTVCSSSRCLNTGEPTVPRHFYRPRIFTAAPMCFLFYTITSTTKHETPTADGTDSRQYMTRITPHMLMAACDRGTICDNFYYIDTSVNNTHGDTAVQCTANTNGITVFSQRDRRRHTTSTTIHTLMMLSASGGLFLDACAEPCTRGARPCGPTAPGLHGVSLIANAARPLAPFSSRLLLYSPTRPCPPHATLTALVTAHTAVLPKRSPGLPLPPPSLTLGHPPPAAA